MRRTKTLKGLSTIRKGKTYFSLFISLAMALTPMHGMGAVIRLKSNFKLRAYNSQLGEMDRVGLLKRGTEIEIPDEYVIVGQNGKPSFDLTLNNWLRKSSRWAQVQRGDNGAGKYEFDGGKFEYFFPIKIKSYGKGSSMRKSANDKEVYLALHYMARNGKGVMLKEDAPVYRQRAGAKTRTRSQETAANTPDYSQTAEGFTEAGFTGYCTDCQDNPSIRKYLKGLADTSYKLSNGKWYKNALAHAEKRAAANVRRTKRDRKALIRNFQKSCGIDWDDFQSEILRQLGGSLNKLELMTGLMLQESSGRCDAVNSEGDKTRSVGLFQINTDSSRYKRCTYNQRQKLKSLSVEQMGDVNSSPQCLENPVLNLKESLRVLKSKKDKLVNYYNFDFSKMKERDQLRMILSAYNGGEKWVGQAKKDLLAFNSKQGTHLDANNWEDLRLFYFRRFLDSNKQNSNFGSYRGRGNRKRDFVISNLAYAEGIIPRRRKATN